LLNVESGALRNDALENSLGSAAMTEQVPATNAQEMGITSSKTTEKSPVLPEKTETSSNQAVKTRKKLFSTLDEVLKTSKEKFDKQKASNSDRQKWARIIISAVAAYGDLLKDVELEGLDERLSRLERQQEKQFLEKFR
jgi:hypothetical protein